MPCENVYFLALSVALVKFFISFLDTCNDAQRCLSFGMHNDCGSSSVFLVLNHMNLKAMVHFMCSILLRMRPLDEQETTAVFEKLYKFVGNNLKHIVERPSSEGPDGKAGLYCFRMQKNRVYYVSEALVKRATNVARDQLVSLGNCIGKFTKGGKFQLTIQCLDLLAAHAKYKIWLKPTAEMSFLYGNHVTKGGLGRITENTAQNEGVVIFNMSDIPLGFGVAAKSTQDCRKLDPNGIVAYHQADIGEYLRMEDEL